MKNIILIVIMTLFFVGCKTTKTVQKNETGLKETTSSVQNFTDSHTTVSSTVINDSIMSKINAVSAQNNDIVTESFVVEYQSSLYVDTVANNSQKSIKDKPIKSITYTKITDRTKHLQTNTNDTKSGTNIVDKKAEEDNTNVQNKSSTDKKATQVAENKEVKTINYTQLIIFAIITVFIFIVIKFRLWKYL